MITIIFIFSIIAFVFIAPILIIYLLRKKIGIKEAWIGLIIMILATFFLTFVEVTSMYAPTLEEQIRLYFINDGQIIFYYIYIPIFISIFISTIMLVIFTLNNKKRG